jgi:hypothetical protein
MMFIDKQAQQSLHSLQLLLEYQGFFLDVVLIYAYNVKWRCLKLRICMIAREFPPDLGGIGHYVYYLSKKLRERGHEITVITRGSAGKTVKEARAMFTSFLRVAEIPGCTDR